MTTTSSYSSVSMNVPTGSVYTYANIADKPDNPGVSVKKTGGGSVITIDPHFTGKALVSAGHWFVIGGNNPNGGLNNDAIISHDAVLAGPVTIRGNIFNDGILSPSAGGITIENVLQTNAGIMNDSIKIDIGIPMQVTGNYSQSATGGVQICLSPNESDTLAFGGSVDLSDGVLYVTPSSGHYTNVRYKVITAGPGKLITGTPRIVPTSTVNVAISADYSISGELSLVLGGVNQSISTTTTTTTTIDPITHENITIVVENADVSQLDNVSGTANIPEGTTLNNLTGFLYNIVAPIQLPNNVTVNTTNNSVTSFSQPLIGNEGAVLNLTNNGEGSGSVQISSNNSLTLKSEIVINNITLGLSDGANVGKGRVVIAPSSTKSAIVLSAVTLPNPISMNAAATFQSTVNKVSVLQGEISGSSDISFSGAGKTVVGGTDASYSSPSYTGKINIDSGEVAVNSVMPNTDLIIKQGATYSGTGTVRNVYHYGTLKPGNSIGTTNIVGNYTVANNGVSGISTSNAVYVVELNASGESNKINVTGDTTISGQYNIKVLMDKGVYKAGVYDYDILQTGGRITTTSTLLDNNGNPIPENFHIVWNSQLKSDNITDKVSFDVGPLSGSDFSDLELAARNMVIGKTLLLKMTVSEEFEVLADQLTINETSTSTYDSIDIAAHPQTIGLNDVLKPASQDYTNLAFNRIELKEEKSDAADDKFRSFKTLKDTYTRQVSGKNGFESLLMAISKSGPMSYEKDEIRLWATPYVNRSRTSRTNSTTGNQGWSGGAVIGLEQRNKKNTWSLGLLTGLTGARASILGDPDTFTKTKGGVFGLYNTLKYSKQWGHELIATRSINFSDSQRRDIDPTRRTSTPYYALSSYKSTTDIGNAQLNYLFDIVKKRITCRLSGGATYQATATGQYVERNAGTNNLLSTASTDKSLEAYSGIGLRRIWDIDNITIRTTFVYEYGYSIFSRGNASTLTTQSVAPTVFTTPVGPRQNKHYLQLNGSYLNRQSGLKFIVSYAGSFYKNVKGHTLSFKAEYRF